MKNSFLWGIVSFLIFGALLTAAYLMNSGAPAEDVTPQVTTENLSELDLMFYDEKLFYQGMIDAKKTAKSLPSDIQGGIIPHHLLASRFIAEFFQTIQEQKPTTIILIGPNHHTRGESQVLTSKRDWKTVFGTVPPDARIIDSLVDARVAGIDDTVLVYEHSMAGIMPYIKYYMPGAAVVPLILKHEMTKEEIENLIEVLTASVSPHMLVVASVDFSHYLSSNQAEKNDEVTLSIMKQFDYPKLLTLNSDYLDSGPSITALLMAMKKLQAENFELLDHSNSSKLSNIDYAETTSYFSIAFH
jgi:AmmeMemoRadiSam system protein B